MKYDNYPADQASFRKYRHILAVALFLFIIYLVKIFWLSSTGTEGKSALEFEIIHVVGRSASKISWILDAEWLKRDTDAGMQYFKKIDYRSFEKDGEARVKADRGHQCIDSRDITFEGNVKAWNTLGHEFHSQKAFYQAATKLLYSDVPVKILRENVTITGNWMVASTVEDTGEVRGNVHIVIEGTGEAEINDQEG